MRETLWSAIGDSGDATVEKEFEVAFEVEVEVEVEFEFEVDFVDFAESDSACFGCLGGCGSNSCKYHRRLTMRPSSDADWTSRN